MLPLIVEALKLMSQAEAKTGCLQVRKDLRLMNWRKLFNALEFKDDSSSHDQIKPLSGKQNAFVWHENLFLHFNRNSGRRQFIKHRLLIDVFDETRS